MHLGRLDDRGNVDLAPVAGILRAVIAPKAKNSAPTRNTQVASPMRSTPRPTIDAANPAMVPTWASRELTTTRWLRSSTREGTKALLPTP